MSIPILTTKLYRPRFRHDLVTRPRLLRKLADGALRPLTLISAPAGFGKTTLIADWIEDSSAVGQSIINHQSSIINQVAWLSLDEGDNDPVRFWTYFIAALQTVATQLGSEALTLLQAPGAPPLEAVLTLLLNDVAALPGSVILVLDDYHTITAATIHDGLTFLVEHLSPNMHLLLVSRTNPPLPLARLRARGQLAEIRATDLRFTQEEATAFLEQVVDVALSPADIAALETRTEGWIAGLQLAALSLRGRQSASDFLQAFTGSHVYIIDYLMEEVLQRLPPVVERFLVQTSILERFNGPLCEVITGQTDAQATLEQLERGNLFLIALDTDRHWYRYHHLFGDVLRHRLRQTAPDTMVDLHRRASQWLAQHGLAAEAIHHAFAGGELERVADLVEQGAESLLKRGEYTTLKGWLNRLPEAVVKARPRLCLFHAATSVITHDLDAAQIWLTYAEQAAQTELPVARERWLAEAAAIGAGVALNRGDFPRTLDLAQRALAALPTANKRLRGEVMLHMGLALSWSGDPAGAGLAYAEAGRQSQEAGDLHTALLALFNQGAQLHMQGRLQQASATFQQALTVASGHSAGRIPITSALHRGLGELYHEWNDLETAAKHLQEALERGERGGLPRVMVLNDLAWAKLLQAQGDTAAAFAIIEKALQLSQNRHLPPRYASPLSAYRARLWLAEGNIAAAADWARSADLDADGDLNYLYEAEYLTLARLLVEQGEASRAARLAARLRQVAESVGRVNSIVEIIGVEALALRAQGDPAAAQATLQRAFDLAEPGGYLRMFVDEGAPMRLLISDCRLRIDDSRLRAYTNRLLAAFGDVEKLEPPTPISNHQSLIQNLIEPLTERELEVLRLVATGLSDRQTAETMIVAIGTVKRHLNNIYGKLGVHSRTQALARARELRLI